MARFLKLTTQSFNKPAAILINIEHILSIDEVNEREANNPWYKTIIYMRATDSDMVVSTMVYEDIQIIMKGLPL